VTQECAPPVHIPPDSTAHFEMFGLAVCARKYWTWFKRMGRMCAGPRHLELREVLHRRARARRGVVRRPGSRGGGGGIAHTVYSRIFPSGLQPCFLSYGSTGLQPAQPPPRRCPCRRRRGPQAQDALAVSHHRHLEVPWADVRRRPGPDNHPHAPGVVPP
jgi:hypothetical protein